MLDNVRDREGLAGTGDTEQGLVGEPIMETGGEPANGLGLIARRAEVAF